jgi:hypothetical protein
MTKYGRKLTDNYRTKMLGFILERHSVQTDSQTDGLTEFQTVGETLREIETSAEGEGLSISRALAEVLASAYLEVTLQP